MQPDLISLEITKGELRRLTGFRPDDILRPAIIKDRDEIVVALALSVIIVGCIYAFIILPTIGSSPLLGIVLLTTVSIAVLIGRSLSRRFKYSKLLLILLNQVDRYYAVIQEIDTRDQLKYQQEQSNINDRVTVVTALQLVREDLIRAFQTERLLRDNKKLLTLNPELFVNHLAELQTLQVSSENEYTQPLNKLLQIAQDVQAQLRKIQPLS